VLENLIPIIRSKNIREIALKYKLYPDRRKEKSKKFIQGSGLEIGALNKPLPVNEEVDVKYVDLFTKYENEKMYPEIYPREFVKTDYVGDGFLLSSINDASQDFVIANHIFEHSPNPILALKNWSRVLKKDGIVFIVVPRVDRCFDNGRSITSYKHMANDYWAYKKGSKEEILNRNKRHLMEWKCFSEQNMLKEQSREYKKPSLSEIKKFVKNYEGEVVDIHFHTFNHHSIKGIFDNIICNFDKTLKIEETTKRLLEVIIVLKKVS